jgi:hypothetical protein
MIPCGKINQSEHRWFLVPYSFQNVTYVLDGSTFQSTGTGIQLNEVYCESPFVKQGINLFPYRSLLIAVMMSRW